ncbi:hypothetical protein C8A00DRAFT_38024 [Chaetomidium leptoderma]|uniref:F-box domain-containing protein n=1 Tax=Chaetomidium leptoderma TaxID=669021 RepID=A0AAN6VDI7_9PEZI|nr:hypothetical protein C8A00DRAFT_38024 [Chaetomidium leptoderma]
MSSAGVMQDEAAGQQRVVSATLLQDLPVETLIEILSNLDFEAFDNMLLVSRRLRSVVELHWPSIFPDIMEREFSPVKGLFDAFWDVDLPCEMACSQLLMACGTLNSLHPLLSFCRVVRRWEVEFTRLRFSNVPQYTRSLQLHELFRLRQGLYVWWRFARSFHGPAACADSSPEARRVFMQQLSTTELHEAYDMWETIRRAVGRTVCPSVSVVRGFGGKLLTHEEGARVGWGDIPENLDIVDTMMRLRPEDILHLLVYRHRYATKASVIRFVRLRHPRIEDSVETFSGAILDVMRQRGVSLFWPFTCPGFPNPRGGILDHREPDIERLRADYSTDVGQCALGDDEWRMSGRPAVVRAGRLEANP